MTAYFLEYPSQFELDKFYATAEALTKLYPFKSPFKGVKVKHHAKGTSYVVEQGHLYVGTYSKLQDAVTAYGAPHTKFKGPLCRLSEFLGVYGCFDPSVDYTAALQAAWDYAKTHASELEFGYTITVFDERAECATDEPVRVNLLAWLTPGDLIKRVAFSLASETREYEEEAWHISVHVALSSIVFRAKETQNV